MIKNTRRAADSAYFTTAGKLFRRRLTGSSDEKIITECENRQSSLNGRYEYFVCRSGCFVGLL